MINVTGTTERQGLLDAIFEETFNADSSVMYVRIKRIIQADTFPNSYFSGNNASFLVTYRIKDNSISATPNTAPQRIYQSRIQNDDVPVITANLAYTINENSAIGTTIGTITATDIDRQATTLSNWTIHSGNDNNWYTINSSTGVISLAGVPDYETSTNDTLAISVSDGTLTSLQENVYITINNLNDITPTVDAGQSFTIPENTTGTLGTLTATDADVGTSFTWSIVSGNTGTAFTLNSTTGVLSVSSGGTLDRETTATYTLGIQVSDGTNTSSTENVTVTLTDLNDNAPVVTTGQSFSVAENTSTGVSLGSVSVTDADLSTTFSNWTITGGNTGSAFSLNSSTGGANSECLHWIGKSLLLIRLPLL